MMPHKIPPATIPTNPTLRVIEPAARCETGVKVDGEVPTIVYASADRIMESARQMLQIHRETFRKLAE